MSDYAEKTGKEVTSMFSSVDAGNAVLALSGKNASKFKDYLDQVRNSVGATSEAFKKIDDGAARQFERLQAELSALVIELGNNALPLINESFIPLFRDTLVPIIDDAIKTISSLIKAFNNLPAPLQATTVGIIGITAGLGPALQGIGSLRKSFVETKKIINDFKGAIGSLKTSVSSIQALSTVWKGFNTVVLASPVGVVTALTAGLGALALKAYKLNQEYKQLIESSQKLTSSTKELNDNSFKDLGLFEEYQKLASAIKLLKSLLDFILI